MDIKSAETAIRRGAITGFVVAGITLLVVSLAVLADADGVFALWNNPWTFIDVVFAAGLAVGILMRSRAAAIILFGYYLLSQILTFAETGRFAGIAMTIVVLYFFGKAIQGTFAYHGIRKATDPDYRSGGRAKVFLWIAGSVFGVILGGLVILGTIALPTAVEAGTELGQSNLDVLRAEGIVEQDERVDLFYSAAILTIRDDGNILTDRRVISYEAIDGQVMVYAAEFADIESISIVEKGDFLADSVVEVTLRDGSYFFLFLSAENDGDSRFLAEVEKKKSN